MATTLPTLNIWNAEKGFVLKISQSSNGTNLTGSTVNLWTTSPKTKTTTSYSMLVSDDGSYCSMVLDGSEFTEIGNYSVQLEIDGVGKLLPGNKGIIAVGQRISPLT